MRTVYVEIIVVGGQLPNIIRHKINCLKSKFPSRNSIAAGDATFGVTHAAAEGVYNAPTEESRHSTIIFNLI